MRITEIEKTLREIADIIGAAADGYSAEALLAAADIIAANARMRTAAQAVVDRWETPLWKDAEPTAEVIYRLRDILANAVITNAADGSATKDPHQSAFGA